MWAGLDDPGGALAALSRAFDDALAKEFRTEIRAFTPHVTVARSEPPLTLAEGWNEPAVQSEPFTIQQVVLLQSHLRSAGPRYVPLATLALGG